MKKIMKKVLSLALVLVMMLSLAPMTTFAEEGVAQEITSGTGVVVSADEPVDIEAYKATSYGVVTIKILEADPGWMAMLTTDKSGGFAFVDYTYAEENKLSLAVYNGDTVDITIRTYDEDNGTCAGTISYEVTFTPMAEPVRGESADYPIELTDTPATVEISAGKTVWYAWYSDVNPVELKIEGSVDGITVVDGINEVEETVAGKSLSMRLNLTWEYRALFSITNNSGEDGEYTIDFATPIGAYENPVVLENLGSETATVNGDEMGCWFAWEAPEDGFFTLTIDENSAWYYLIAEYSSASYEETPVAEQTVEVPGGTTILFNINKYVGQGWMVEAQAGTVDFEIAFVAGEISQQPEEDEYEGPEVIKYENKVKPVKFNFVKGEGDKVLKVNIADKKIETAVLGKDGYYHLNSADGPVLFVSIGSKAPYAVSPLDLLADEMLTFPVKDENGEVTHYIDYNEAMAEYSACEDTEMGYYPLTEDLIKVYKHFGETYGNYKNTTIPGTDMILATSIFNVKDEEGDIVEYVDGDENAWMYACYYVEPASEVEVLEGKDSTWTIGSTEAATVRFKADFNMFKAVRVDGKIVDPANYEVKEGSIIVSLKADYLKTLGAGEHTLTVELLNTQMVSTSLTIAKAADTTTGGTTGDAEGNAPGVAPKTGDDSNIVLWFAVLGFGVVAMAGSVVIKKREF